MADDLLDRLLAPPSKQDGDPLDRLIQAQQRDRALVTLANDDTPPDAAAKAFRIAKQSGLPAPLVARNIKSFEANDRARLWSEAMREHPKLSPWLNEPAHFSIAADDHKAVTSLAQSYDPKEWARKNGSIYSTPAPAPTFWNGVKGVFGSLQTIIPNLKFLGAELSDKIGGSTFFRIRREEAAPPRPAGPFLRVRPETAQDIAIRETKSTPESRAAFRAALQAQARAEALNPQYQNIFARTAYSAGTSGIQMLPGVALSVALRNPAPGLALAGVTAGAPAYTKYRGRGASVEQAAIAAYGEGATEVITETLPMGFLVDKLGRIGFGKFLAEYIGRDLVGEQVATIVQDAIDTAVANPDKTWGDYLRERPNAALETALTTLWLAAVPGAANVGLRRLQRDQGEAIGAEAGAEFLDDLAAKAAASKTRQRSPDAFASLLKSLGGDTVENVYVPGEVVRQYLQSDENYDREFWSQYGAQVEESIATGGDVVIPAEQAIAHLSGTQAWEALKDDMRLTPGGMSLREAAQVEADYTGAIERNAADASAQIAADLAEQEPRRRLYDAYVRKLQEAGFTPEVAQQYAELATARAATRAARLGQELTGSEADALVIRQSDQIEALAAEGRTFEQSGEFAKNAMAEIQDRFPGVKADIAQRRDTATISRLEVPADQRNSGIGSAVMQLLTERADEAGVRLALSPSGAFGGTVSRLRGFYRRFGFVDNKERGRSFTTRETMVRNAPGQVYDQSYLSKVRGRVQFATDGRTIVQLFEERNLSTFIHESGHIWLEELKADAESEGATDQIKADWETVKAWFASNGHKIGKDGMIPTEAHELWARGVERYTMEGKAPSSVLRRVFDAFRSWLLSIYQVVENLRSPISPEVRAVMERLIATDEEIAAAAEEQSLNALFTDAAQAGMTEAEFAAYLQSTQEARSEAFDALLYRTMAAIRAARTKEYRDQEATVRADVTQATDSRPEFRALAALREKGGAKLDRQWLIRTYGEDALSLVPQSVPPIHAERGVPADEIAEANGFQSGDEMVRTLMSIEAQRKAMRDEGDKRTVRQRLIDEETDSIMKDRYGDPLNDGSIEREARELIHNDRQGEVIASELRALNRMRRRPSDLNQAPTAYQLAKRWAARKVAEGTVAEYTSRSAIQRFQRAARKAGEAAEQAILAGDIDETYRQKQAQMLNNALVVEATKAADAVDAAVGRLGRVAKRRTIKSVDQDYLEQAQALLEQVDLKARSQISIDRQGAFETWARAREAEGHDVVVPPSFAASLGMTHYSRLSVEKLLGLDETVKQIIHLGRLKQTLIDGKEQREFDAVVREAQDAAGKLPPRPPSDLYDPNWLDRFKSGVAGIDAALLKLETIFDWLDGGDANGVFNRIAFRPIAEAQDRENAMLRDYYDRVRKAMAKLPKEDIGRWDEKVTAPELLNRETGNPFVYRRQNLIAIALNMGNEGNIQRLVDGYGWDEGAVRRVLDRELSAAEWGFVQDIWDTFETLWPEIARMERAINGVEPEKVEARPIETPHGTFRGGYYPAIYDSRRDVEAEQNVGKETDKFGQLYTRATTRASATKERAQQVKRPLLLQVGVINRHLGEVIHDITHREAVMQADKFLSSRRVIKAVDDTLGPEIRKQFQPWLKFVANSWAMERSGNEGLGKFINKARANTTVVGMAWRASTILTQLAGYSNSFEYVGPRWVTPEIAKFAAQLSGKVIQAVTFQGVEMPPMMAFVMERSGEVRNRMDTLDRDIRLTIAQMAGKRDLVSDAKRFMFHGIGYADRIVVIPTWLGAYNKALASGASEADAIYEADKAVRKSQGAGSPKDLAAVQRGTGKWGEVLRIATMFYSYMSAFYQRERTLGRDIAGAVRERNIRMTPRLLARSWWLIAVPPLLSELLAGRGPDDDEDWGWWTFERMLVNILGPIPFARDLVAPIWNAITGDQVFDYKLSPLQNAGQSLVEVAKDVGRTAQGKETTKATKHALEAAGYATGLVPGQVATSVQFLVDVGQDEQDPESVREWYNGLTKGKAEPVKQ